MRNRCEGRSNPDSTPDFLDNTAKYECDSRYVYDVRAWCSRVLHTWDSFLKVCYHDGHWFLFWEIALYSSQIHYEAQGQCVWMSKLSAFWELDKVWRCYISVEYLQHLNYCVTTTWQAKTSNLTYSNQDYFQEQDTVSPVLWLVLVVKTSTVYFVKEFREKPCTHKLKNPVFFSYIKIFWSCKCHMASIRQSCGGCVTIIWLLF